MQKASKDRESRRAFRQKKRTALFLCAAVLLALLLVLLQPVKNTSQDTGSVPFLPLHFETLDEADADDLLSIAVTQREGEAYTLVYENERLYLQREGALAPIDEKLTSKIIRSATLIAVEDTVGGEKEEIQQHLPDMGLAPPEITVKVSYRSGREDVLQIGVHVPETTYYYYRWSGSDGVYMCDEGTFEAFAYPSALLLPVDQPLLTKNLIDYMSLRIHGKAAMELRFSTDNLDVVSGMLQEPYQYPLDTAKASDMVTAAVNFRLGSFQADITEESFVVYGFDNPLAEIEIHQQAGSYGAIDETGVFVTYESEEEELRFVIGRPEGDYFYTCLYDQKCYFVSRFLLASLVSASPEALITQYPADMGEAVLAEIQVQLGGSIMDFRRQKTERVLPNNQLAVDEEGNTIYDVTATKNGEPMRAEAFDTLVMRLKAMKVSGDADASFSAATVAPRWQMTLVTDSGNTRTIIAYPLDAFFDAISIDGMIKHTLHAESLEAAMSDLMANSR